MRERIFYVPAAAVRSEVQLGSVFFGFVPKIVKIFGVNQAYFSVILEIDEFL